MPAVLHFSRELAVSVVRTGDSGWHAHRALQATLSLDGPFRFGDEAGEAPVGFAATAPMQRHRVQGDGARLAYLFFDVGPRAYAAWEAAGGRPKAPPAPVVAALRRLADGGLAADEAPALARDWCAATWPDLALRGPEDARLARALAAVDADPLAPWTHRSLAERAHLSPSRFQVLFREATGLPVRNYLLWRRLLRAVDELQAGASVTAAAHAAGFADAAHLSRSFRHVIGAAPSSLLAPR